MRRLWLLVAVLLVGCGSPPLSLDDDTSDADNADELDTSESSEASDTSESTSAADPCTEAHRVIEGDVLIESAAQLLELDDVVEIRGDLQISDDTMVELVGLDCVERVSGWVRISGNDALERIDDALGRLRRIDADDPLVATGLSIGDNPNLVSLTGLRSLEHVAGRTLVTDNPALVELRFDALVSTGEHMTLSDAPVASLAGLASLREVAGQLTISNCDQLVDLDGLQALELVGGGWSSGGLSIANNDALLGFHGLTLASIPQLRIANNPALVDLAGLEALVEVERLTIEDNPTLASLHGLDNLVAVTGSDGVLDGVSIVRNPALAELAGLGSLAQIESHLHLCDNATLTDLSALAGLESLARLTAIYNDTLDGMVAEQLAAGIADIAWVKVDANGQLPPLWWDKPECPWAGDLICDEQLEFQGDVEVTCEQDCCDLLGPTRLCGPMSDGMDRGDCLDRPFGPPSP